MQLAEPIDVVNQRLIDYFGLFEDQPKWRLVFSDDQFEKRHGTFNDYTPEGFFVRQVTEIRLVPKYRQWIQHKWVLERLTAVPEQCQEELLTRLSYEPIWVFEDKKGNPLPPIWLAIEFIIQSMFGHVGKKYVVPSEEEANEKRIQSLQESLFGNESVIADSLAYKEAVSLAGANDGIAGMGSQQQEDS